MENKHYFFTPLSEPSQEDRKRFAKVVAASEYEPALVGDLIGRRAELSQEFEELENLAVAHKKSYDIAKKRGWCKEYEKAEALFNDVSAQAAWVEGELKAIEIMLGGWE